VQAIRKIEPLLWRPFGWCHLEVDVAGSVGREQDTRSSSVTRSLLPVGPNDTADELLRRLVSITGPPLVKPPSRVKWKTPLSYHFLAAGHDDTLAAASTGRLRKVTTWVPLEKIQSIRWVQGPLQRTMALASIHVDAAGRRVRAEFRDRALTEADRFLTQLVASSRLARRQGTRRVEVAAATMGCGSAPSAADGGHGGPAAGLAIPAGWYEDPSGQHQYRYWDGNKWTENVGDHGATALDPL
jgi:putative membrane protein